MAAFPFFQRDRLAEQARHIQLTAFTPTLELEGLLAGIDNVRHDVYLSPVVADAARQHIRRLMARDGNVEGVLASPAAISSVPPQIFRRQEEAKAQAESGDFKRLLAELLVEGLNYAKAEDKPSLDLLLRVAIVKFLRSELTSQYNWLLGQVRAKLSEFEGPRQSHLGKGIELRERHAAFQLGKKTLLRKASLNLFQTLREIEKETLARMRRALFGGGEDSAYAVLLNRLMFTDDGRDDYMNAEHYVMLGNFDRDPDRLQAIEAVARSFLEALELKGPDGSELEIDPLLNVPENAQELMAGGAPDESSAEGKAQKVLLEAWADMLERADILGHVIAAYEAAPLLAEYSPPINAQQLKVALISRTERARVQRLLQEHGRLSPANFEAAVKRAAGYRSADRMKVAGRFLLDFIHYHRDLRYLDALKAATERVSVISNDRLRELSAINRTLYEFLLPREQKAPEEKVAHHVILKADIRDSTSLTRTLFERGLNPASYFSLNFYEPVNKLLAKYQATKVFIEGDAVILALFGHEGKQEFAVARTCAMAREMTSIVHAYNEKSHKAGLPTLELGIGISFQDSAPMYLMDGEARIMISKALNESDRLSSCNKGARWFLHGNENLFNVYTFKTVEDEETAGNPDEFLMRYNVGGVHISAAAFQQLQREISLELHELELPTPWGQAKARLHCGLAPLGSDIFRPLIVREAPIARIDGSTFSFKEWTERHYYEVCTNDAVYYFPELQAGSRAVAQD